MEQNLIYQNQEEPQQNPPYDPSINASDSYTSYNSTQNIQTPEEPYYSSQSTNNVQQYPEQLYKAPNQSYYTPQRVTPIQSGVPISDYPLQPADLSVYPTPQDQYYKSYSLIKHKGIFLTKTNNFYLNTGCCMKSIPFITFFISFSFIFFMSLFLPDTWIPFTF